MIDAGDNLDRIILLNWCQYAADGLTLKQVPATDVKAFIGRVVAFLIASFPHVSTDASTVASNCFDLLRVTLISLAQPSDLPVGSNPIGSRNEAQVGWSRTVVLPCFNSYFNWCFELLRAASRYFDILGSFKCLASVGSKLIGFKMKLKFEGFSIKSDDKNPPISLVMLSVFFFFKRLQHCQNSFNRKISRYKMNKWM